MALAIPDFTYRAVMDDGTVEHEVCPVVIAEVDVEPMLNPDEVDDAEWITWGALRERASEAPQTLSPWSVAQIERLGALAASPQDWLASANGQRLLDAPPFGSGAPSASMRAAGRSPRLRAYARRSPARRIPARTFP